MKNFEILEVGRTYKNRIGGLIKIIKIDYNDHYHPFFGDNDRYYTPNGRYISDVTPYEHDLVELIEDTPTLAPNGQDAQPLTISSIDAKIAKLQELRKELDKNIEVSDNSWGDIIGVRTFGKYEEKGFRLSSRYNWEIVNECGDLVLIPTKK